jgi:hypothetical protein
MEGSAVKADATANVPSRPTASRFFAIAGQVRARRMSQYVFVFHVMDAFSVFWYQALSELKL